MSQLAAIHRTLYLRDLSVRARTPILYLSILYVFNLSRALRVLTSTSYLSWSTLFPVMRYRNRRAEKILNPAANRRI